MWAVLQFRLAGSVKPREKVAIEVELRAGRWTVSRQLGVVVAIKTERTFPLFLGARTYFGLSFASTVTWEKLIFLFLFYVQPPDCDRGGESRGK